DLRAAQAFFLELLALGQIARDFGETHELSGGSAQRRDDHVGPEPRAILAHPKALGLETTLSRSDLQLVLAKPRAGQLFLIEAGKMLTDDLARGIALDALGTCVPGGDAAVRVEHDNCVVFYALHEQTELLPAIAEVFGSFPGA